MTRVLRRKSKVTKLAVKLLDLIADYKQVDRKNIRICAKENLTVFESHDPLGATKELQIIYEGKIVFNERYSERRFPTGKITANFWYSHLETILENHLLKDDITYLADEISLSDLLDRIGELRFNREYSKFYVSPNGTSKISEAVNKEQLRSMCRAVINYRIGKMAEGKNIISLPVEKRRAVSKYLEELTSAVTSESLVVTRTSLGSIKLV